MSFELMMLWYDFGTLLNCITMMDALTRKNWNGSNGHEEIILMKKYFDFSDNGIDLYVSLHDKYHNCIHADNLTLKNINYFDKKNIMQ